MDLTSIDFPDIRWLHGVFYCNSSRFGRDKKYHPWSGVKTDLGEIEEKAWCQIAEALINRKGESALLKSLIEWETNHNYAHASKEVVRKEALQLHVARLFDNPLWVHFVPFNRQYRPEVLETAHLVTVVNECCNSINRQVDKLRCNSVILMEQIRTIDKSRLMDRIGVLNDYEMQQVNQALGISVGLV